MWVDADDEHVLINTEVHRAKYKAIEADPNVTVTSGTTTNAYQYGEVRGPSSARCAAPRRGPTSTHSPSATPASRTAARCRASGSILKIAPERQRSNGL